MTPHSVPVSAEELLRHRAWVRALARTLARDDASVDDLEQDVWVAALERPPQHSEAATTWLTRVVRSRAVDMFRSHARRGAREEAAARPEAVPSAAETLALLTRRTGDSYRDLPPASLAVARRVIEGHKDAERLLALLEGKASRDAASLARIFGEELPSGLVIE